MIKNAKICSPTCSYSGSRPHEAFLTTVLLSQLDPQTPVGPAEVVDPVHQIADRLPDVGKPREREAPADLMRVYPPDGAVVPFHDRGIRRGVAKGHQFRIDAPSGTGRAFDPDVRHPLALVRLDDPHVP